MDAGVFAVDSPGDYGYRLKGEKGDAKRHWHAGRRASTIGAITKFRLLSVGLFSCHIDAGVLYARITQELLSDTVKHSVIVPDKC